MDGQVRPATRSGRLANSSAAAAAAAGPPPLAATSSPRTPASSLAKSDEAAATAGSASPAASSQARDETNGDIATSSSRAGVDPGVRKSPRKSTDDVAAVVKRPRRNVAVVRAARDNDHETTPVVAQVSLNNGHSSKALERYLSSAGENPQKQLRAEVSPRMGDYEDGLMMLADVALCLALTPVEFPVFLYNKPSS